MDYLSIQMNYALSSLSFCQLINPHAQIPATTESQAERHLGFRAPKTEKTPTDNTHSWRIKTI